MQVKDLILEYLNQPYFKSAVAFLFLFFLHRFSIGNGQQGISHNSYIHAINFAYLIIENN